MFLIKFRDSIYGGKDNDTITDETSTGGQNFIRGDIGQDSVYVRGDRDTIYGGKDNDTLISEGSRVYVRGDDGNDIVDNLQQGSPTDRSTLLGGEGDDSIRGGVASSGNSRNLLDGEAGNDTLFGQGVRDTLMGSEGNDSISINTSTSSLNLLDGGAGEDTLLGGSSTDTMIGGSGNDFLSKIFNKGDGGGGNDTIDASQTGTSVVPQITLIGGAGNDSLVGNTNSGVSNFFDDGTGNDFIQFGTTNDKLIGNTEGNDTIIAFETGTSFVSFTIEDTLGSNTLSGYSGPDILVTGAGDDSIVGGDTLETGDDSIVAGAGDDIIFGRGGRDTILGDAGNDYIAPGINGTGDSLIGGEGDDSFVFFVANTSTRKSVIVDFNATDDRILLSDAGFNLANSEAGKVIRNADFLALDPGKNYNNNANSTNPTIIYEIEPLKDVSDGPNSARADSGILKYDPNGNGGTGVNDVVVIARLNGNPDINASDIFII
jgi:Ca2+-binding RTX toxin-like protein